jgi:hypothetical protein
MGMKRMTETSKSLGEMRNRRVKGFPDLRTQIEFVGELMGRLEEIREKAQRKRLEGLGGYSGWSSTYGLGLRVPCLCLR